MRQKAAGVVLNSSNLRMTHQRQVILEELRQVRSHPSADEVYDLVRKRIPRISLGTVYRNLEVLSETGEIQKVESCGSPKRFDGNPEDHYHIRCISCDRVVDAPADINIDVQREFGETTDFKVIGYKLEFFGLCPRCSKSSNPTE
jgi:Fur family ferric uptake transcriptional regulator